MPHLTRRLIYPIAAAAGLVLAGCSAGNAIDEGAPRSAAADQYPLPPPARPGDGAEGAGEQPSTADSQSQYADDPVFSGSGQARKSGQFPNINVEPQGAAIPLSDGETAAKMDRLKALGQALAKGRISVAEYNRKVAELRRLGATHSDETIKRIEN